MRRYLFCLSVGIFILINFCCFNSQRQKNRNWQLDSLRYYTVKIDSILKTQATEISQLRADFYTKSDELGEKIEMLGTRMGESESQLTRIDEKLGTGNKFAADSTGISKLSSEARLLYESAYLNYVKGNYQEALNDFQAYLKSQPDSPIADNAFYWIGESYAALGKRQDAVNTFQTLINKYPKSSRIPTALYKMGIIYEEAKDKKSANFYYNKLIKEFPNSPEAALAQDKLK